MFLTQTHGVWTQVYTNDVTGSSR